MRIYKRVLLLFAMITGSFLTTHAGPPFDTDDPEPVEYRHWEYYISSVNGRQHQSWSGTLPHFEVNYGVVPNVQLHLLLPMNYSYSHGIMNFGYASTEMGVKYRFIKETSHIPQVGIFPIVEIPTLRNSNFGNGKTQAYFPVWIQKSWGKLTSYGGGGYWINPGAGNKNWWFGGWEAQYDFTTVLTLGGEIYFHSPSDVLSSSMIGFNMGGFVNFTPKCHLIFSLGHSISNIGLFSSYIGLLWTI